jgi:HD-GYP domain-containing protein (c-di-GMP phosphodiesterase class II)
VSVAEDESMARILVVCKDNEEGKGLARLLRRDGHKTWVVRSAVAVDGLIHTALPDVLVMAVADPAGMLRELGRPIGSQIRRTPALAIVRDEAAAELDRDQPGLLDVLPMPFSEEAFLARVDAMLRVKDVLFGSSETSLVAGGPSSSSEGRSAWGRLLDGLSGRSLFSSTHRERPLEPYLDAAASIVDAVEIRDALDPGHGQRVATHCASIAINMGLHGRDRDALIYAASVHDIGKIIYPAELLRKPVLTDSERRLLRHHPRRGADLIKALTPYAEAAEIILLHHERPDGQGYYGRPPEEVPMLASILGIADVFDGLTSSHPGSPGLSPNDALELLREGRGTVYEASCVDAALAVVRPARRSIPLSEMIGADRLQ